MIIIFGLGNPGKKFAGTRHNLGQEIVNSLQKKWGFSKWQKKAKLKAEISKGEIKDKEILLAKSLTYMNESGKAIKLLVENCKLKIENFIVIHDDVDLPLGKIKISKGKGSAGHKGVESVIKELGTKEFARFRVGIWPMSNVLSPKATPRRVASQMSNLHVKSQMLDNFVLAKFAKDEKKIIKDAINKTIGAIELALREGTEKAMQEFNKNDANLRMKCE